MWSEQAVPGVGLAGVGQDRESEFYLKGFRK